MLPPEILSRRRFLATAASVFAANRVLRGQDQDQPDAKYTSDVNVVNVFATVRDSKGHIVQTLAKDDFALAEDDRPQTIRYFARESSLPLTLGVLVDTSMSQRRVLGQEKDASYKFLDTVLREDKDKAFLIHFDHEVELLQDLTPSRKKLESALADMGPSEGEQPGGWNRGGGPSGGGPGGGRGGYGGHHGGHHGGGTCLYDSILLASDELMKKQTGRKALVVLTDGVDNGSKVNMLKAIESAQRADTLVYSILFADPNAYGAMGPGRGGRGGWGGGYPGRGSRTDGKPILQRISRMTGGGFFEVTKKDSIDAIYGQIQEELRNQYSLGYTPDQADATGAYHRIQLTTKETGLIVQTRDGYYARAKT